MNYFIGNKRQNEAKWKVERAIRVATTPIWVPFWLIMIITYYISALLEDKVFAWFEKILNSSTEFVVRKFVK